jgi:SNF2 family DNA or RNA helicase
LSLKAGGTGLNLTAAANVIHYDLWWNPAVEAQATDRAYRIGQKSNVMVYRLITQGTFEEKIDEMLKLKKQLADMTVSVGENWIGNMSNSDLKALVSLD